MLALAAWSGCACVSQVSLTQPQTRGRQQYLELASTQTYWSSDGRVERILAEFPLPGARTGEPIFLLYLRVSPPLVAPSKRSSDAYAVRGFLVQTRGEYAGRVDVQSAGVTVARLSADSHIVDVDVQMEDASRICGRLAARRDDARLKWFETERRPGDVQSLLRQDQ